MFIGSDNGFQDVKIVYTLLVFTPAAFFVPPPAFLVVLLTLTGTAVPSSPFVMDMVIFRTIFFELFSFLHVHAPYSPFRLLTN